MSGMMELDDRNAGSVIGALGAGAAANRDASCRRGSIDEISAPGTLIATGDLHDNPIHLAKLVRAAGMDGARGCGGEQRAAQGKSRGGEEGTGHALAHLVLQELIHGERLVNGMDFSYRVLARAAALKAAYPEHVHVLLANHELSQMLRTEIVKDGVKVVEAFTRGVEYVFGDGSGGVLEAIDGFVRSMPLALRCRCPGGDVLCAHSVPAPWAMARFDPGVLERGLTDDDYQPRQGSAYLMVWGREYDAELLEDLVERWGVRMFILGHEKVEGGAMFVAPCAIVLNSDHERGVYLPLDLDDVPGAEEAVGRVVGLAQDAR